MDINIHIGAHRTATKHLQTQLVENEELLQAQGIWVAPRRNARRAINNAANNLGKNVDLDIIQAEMLEELTMGAAQYHRIVISNEFLSGNVSKPFGRELFYPRIRDNMNKLVGLFSGMNVKLFVGLRNPATFIPSCYNESVRAGSKESFAELIADTHLQGLRWSNYLHRAQGNTGENNLTVWRYEDYPYIWRDVVQAVTGVDNKEDLVGTTETVNQGVSYKGAQLLKKYFDKHGVDNDKERKRVVHEFGQLYPSFLNEPIGPEWPEELVEGLTENYEDDWYYIERMDNVQAITRRDLG